MSKNWSKLAIGGLIILSIMLSVGCVQKAAEEEEKVKVKKAKPTYELVELEESALVKNDKEADLHYAKVENNIATLPDMDMKKAKKIVHEGEEIAEENFPITIYPQAIFDMAKKALDKDFSVEDTAEIHVSFQKALLKGVSVEEAKDIVMEGLDQGLTAAEIDKKLIK